MFNQFLTQVVGPLFWPLYYCLLATVSFELLAQTVCKVIRAYYTAKYSGTPESTEKREG